MVCKFCLTQSSLIRNTERTLPEKLLYRYAESRQSYTWIALIVEGKMVIHHIICEILAGEMELKITYGPCTKKYHHRSVVITPCWFQKYNVYRKDYSGYGYLFGRDMPIEAGFFVREEQLYCDLCIDGERTVYKCDRVTTKEEDEELVEGLFPPSSSEDDISDWEEIPRESPSTEEIFRLEYPNALRMITNSPPSSEGSLTFLQENIDEREPLLP